MYVVRLFWREKTARARVTTFETRLKPPRRFHRTHFRSYPAIPSGGCRECTFYLFIPPHLRFSLRRHPPAIGGGAGGGGDSERVTRKYTCIYIYIYKARVFSSYSPRAELSGIKLSLASFGRIQSGQLGNSFRTILPTLLLCRERRNFSLVRPAGENSRRERRGRIRKVSSLARREFSH